MIVDLKRSNQINFHVCNSERLVAFHAIFKSKEMEFLLIFIRKLQHWLQLWESLQFSKSALWINIYF